MNNKHYFYLLMLVIIIVGCTPSVPTNSKLVTSKEDLYKALINAKAGDEIIMANGTWKDVAIVFTGEGTKQNPIRLRAEAPGHVFIEGESFLKFGGQFLEVSGLYFRNGYTPEKAVVAFRIDKNKIANNCRFTNSVIENYNQLQRDRPDHWVEFWGRHNQLDHCYIAGKSNQGPTVRVDIKGNQNIRNYHKIINNYFGPRPRKGGPKGETIQLGDSYTSMSPSNTLVANNYFDRCNGEVEVISSKTNFNEFRNNLFYKCEGSLVTRHGNYAIIDGNYFIGDGKSENFGGIRLINTGHWVTNNYFFNLRGKKFRSSLAIMNGIPKSPLNRYNQVTDVVVAHNTWVNCNSPWQFGVGQNLNQREVLPQSEIRSARAIRTLIANNVLYNEVGDSLPIVAHDKIDGITFKSNIINNQGVDFKDVNGLRQTKFQMTSINEYLFIPKDDLTKYVTYQGFEFDKITKDILGRLRSDNNLVGAVNTMPVNSMAVLDSHKYGASWFTPESEPATGKTLEVDSNSNLNEVILNAKSGDTISLLTGDYYIDKPLRIDKNLTIRSKKPGSKARILYTGNDQSPLFELNPKGFLKVENLIIKGSKKNYAFASLKENMSSRYKLSVSKCEISEFNYVLKAYKQSFADEINFDTTIFYDCENGIELSEETNDKGDYNVEFLNIHNCQFSNIKSNVIDYYRGGYDESTIGGNLSVSNSTFSNCGAKEANGILLNTRGIINVDISNNTFKNNKVKLVALLWGAKNNKHTKNTISNSGKILVKENIQLTLMY